ncbi:hypothetical protein [Sphingomonas radiodurans]|uniref:hypothetical protein n=1 Tax=Sphingomonas radiodurans TaxID=2890321 RepID=UPI001E410D9A|nr:hypothetical protein [Sphingomonas radiodurans]WBH16880.1 hypothetical protein LLW23_01800 [Sphingomonas radiodurans]
MKTLLIAARVFALLTLSFVPAFTVLLLVGFISGDAGLFAFLGLPALLVNAIFVFGKPRRDRAWRWATGIAGKPERP